MFQGRVQVPNTVLGFMPMFSSAAARLTGPPQLSEAVLNGDLQMPADFCWSLSVQSPCMQLQEMMTADCLKLTV